MTPQERRFVRNGIGPAIADGFTAAGREIVEEIQAEIATAYPPASAPGTPPHLRTGNLRGRMDSTVVSNVNGGEITLTIENDAFYAAFLRDGTGKMAARDFMQDSKLDDYLPRVVDAVVDELESRFK